jgi:ribosomal protein S18 acetylase RimI-like enzyme
MSQPQNPNPLTIRPATVRDLAELQRIGRQTFLETFAASNSEPNMQAYLAEGFAAEKLTAELLNPDSAFYFAELAGTVVGYLKVNTGPAQTEPQAAPALEIERIYVLRAHQGQRVGQALYEKALALAAQAGAEYVWLGVWEENPRAIGFYQKNGFVAFGQHVFTLGDEAQTDILMKRRLPGGRR